LVRALRFLRRALGALRHGDEPWRLAGMLLAPFRPGTSPAGLLNALVPRQGYRVLKDLAYGEGPRHRLDVYCPEPRGEPAAAPATIVVFLYGGQWKEGSKELYLFVGEALTSRGFIAVIPDYRIYPQVRFPDFLEDCAACVRWVAAHAAEWGGDADRLFLMGHSAGAYNAVMLGLDRRWLAVGDESPVALRGAIGLAGPYDFLPLRDPVLKAIFGRESDWPMTQPIAYVDGTAPPLLLATGRADTAVDPANTTRLAARIRAKGGHVVERYYPDLTHSEVVGAFARSLRFMAPVLDDAARFIAETSE
jgi:acetyl esterase/lipase